MEPSAEAVSLEALEKQFLILGNAQHWVDPWGEMQENCNPTGYTCARARRSRKWATTVMPVRRWSASIAWAKKSSGTFTTANAIH